MSLPFVSILPVINEKDHWQTKAIQLIRSSTSRQGGTIEDKSISTEDRSYLCVKAPNLRRTKTEPDGVTLTTIEHETRSQDEDIEQWIQDNLPSRDRPQERVSSIVSLSSTSSCEMYTNTDVSDDERELEPDAAQPCLPKSAHKMIDMVLRKAEIELRKVACRQCTSNTASNTRGATSAPRQGRKPSQSAGQKRKTRPGGSPPPNDDDEYGSNKRRRESAITVADGSESGAKFACPFYKHDPDRYRHRRTCPGPGFPTVHRVKEHLYRSHTQPIFCPICYETFKSDKELLNHVRLQQCERCAPQTVEGIDRETIHALRKRSTALRLEEDKWRDVYHVLFPDVPMADIPSPCKFILTITSATTH